MIPLRPFSPQGDRKFPTAKRDIRLLCKKNSDTGVYLKYRRPSFEFFGIVRQRFTTKNLDFPFLYMKFIGIEFFFERKTIPQ